MDQMQIGTVFSFHFKLGRKAVGTACDNNDAFGLRTTYSTMLTTTNWEPWSKSIHTQPFWRGGTISTNGCHTTWAAIKKIAILNCLLLVYPTRTTCFSTGMWVVTKRGLSMTASKLHNTVRSWNCMQKGYRDCLVVCSRSYPWAFSEYGRNITVGKTVRKSTKYVWKFDNSRRCWTEKGRFFTSTREHMSQNHKKWTNWAMKLCLIRYTHRTFCLATTTF